MRIKSINYSPLSFGFKILLITSIFYSCHPEQVNNPGLVIPENEELPTGWSLEKNEHFSITKSDVKGFSKPFLESKEAGEILFSQTISLDSGNHYLMAKYKADVSEGVFFIKSEGSNGIFVQSSESICLRTICFISLDRTKNVKIEFGFAEGSIGNALIDTIMTYPANYTFDLGERNKAKIQLIDKNLNLILKQDEHLDENVDLLAASINTAYLPKYHTKNPTPMNTYQLDIFTDKSTSYLSTFINSEDRGAYCQKSSLSIDELLQLYQIPTRQLHWQKDCSGFHQFLEYWNESDKKWKIIDPYYGIRYVAENGVYLGFEEVEALVRQNKFSKNNIQKIDIGRAFYIEKEILEGWIDSDLAVHVLNK